MVWYDSLLLWIRYDLEVLFSNLFLLGEKILTLFACI